MTGPSSAAVDTAAVLALLEAEDRAVESAVSAAQAAVGSLVMGFDDWYDSDAITSLTHSISQTVQGFTRGVARTADAFMTRTIAMMTGRIVHPAGAVRQAIAGPRAHELRRIPESAGILNGDRNGITRPGIYGRVADTYRWQTAKIDEALIEAVRSGIKPTGLVDPDVAALARARRAVDTDLKLARRAQMHRTLSRAAQEGLVTGYRRIIHPEVSRGGTCGLCIAASTRVYRVDHLQPLHGGCHCSQLPVARGVDPGVDINDDAYEEALAITGGHTDRDSLRRTRFRVDHHGELGPVLAPADQPIRTPAEVRRDTNRPRRPKTPEQKRRTLEHKRATVQAEADRLSAKIKAGEVDAGEWQGVLDRLDGRVFELDRAMRGL